MTTERRFSREEAQNIIEHVAKKEIRDLEADISESALVELGREVGLKEEDVRRAIEGAGVGALASKRVLIHRYGDSVRIRLRPPRFVPYCLARTLFYAFAVTFSVVVIVRSDSSIVAAVATAPFLLIAGALLWQTIGFAATTATIEIDSGRVVARTSGLGEPSSLSGSPRTTHAQGPLFDGSWGARVPFLGMHFVRIVTDAGDIDLGHGHSERDLRAVLRAIEPLVAGAKKTE